MSNPKNTAAIYKEELFTGTFLAVFIGCLVLFILMIVTFEKHKTKCLNWFLRIMITLMLCYVGGYVTVKVQDG